MGKLDLRHVSESITRPPSSEFRTGKHRSGIHRMTPSSTFDALEADFFAREADLYKDEKVESFSDLDRKSETGTRQNRGAQKPNQQKRGK